MKKIIFFFLLLIIFSCSKTNEQSEQIEPVEQITETRNWSEYIDFRVGNIPLLIISVHGGGLEPEWIQTRTCDQATVVRDSYTRDVALEIESQFIAESELYSEQKKIEPKKEDKFAI